jgi:hypothetical protein
MEIKMTASKMLDEDKKKEEKWLNTWWTAIFSSLNIQQSISSSIMYAISPRRRFGKLFQSAAFI